MKKAIFTVILISLNFASAGVASSAMTLSSLPTRWEGVAGDLVVRVPAVFVISKSKLVESSPDQQTQEYEIGGSFQLGSRSVNVTSLSLRNYSSNSVPIESIEMTIFTEDELVPTITVIVRYDKKTSKYTMSDLMAPPDGRQFVLKGSTN